MYDYATLVAGASVRAAETLLLGIADVAINWCGGWHHAKRSVAIVGSSKVMREKEIDTKVFITETCGEHCVSPFWTEDDTNS